MRPSGILIPAFLLTAGQLAAQPAIGEWRDHFQYRQAIALVNGGEDIYCATSSAVFKFNKANGETERYTKVNLLSEVDILSLGWNDARSTLLVGYQSGNLDLVRNGQAINMPDIKRSSVVGDKGIYCISQQGTQAYLGCGFGIVVVDLERSEVKETWFIGPDGARLKVNAIAFHQDSIYAATDEGLYAAWQGEANLAAYANWHKRTDIPGANGPFTEAVSFSGRLFVNRRVDLTGQAELDTIYFQDGGWNVFTAAGSGFHRSMRVSYNGQNLEVTGLDKVREYDTNLQEMYYIHDINGTPVNAMDAIRAGQEGLWLASNGMGLVHFMGSTHNIVQPNGPATNSVYRMAAAKGVLYATTGGISSTWGNMYRKEGVHYLADGLWHTTNRANDPMFASGGNEFGGSLNDPMAVAVDPDDGWHAFMGSWDDGVLEMHNGHGTTFFLPNNSSLQAFQNSTASDAPTQVGGLAYDENGNLWATNSNCAQPISVRMRSGNWYAMGGGSALGANTLLGDIIVAKNGYKWAVRPRSSGLYVFTDNGTPSDPGDDLAKALNTYEGQGKLPSMDVFSLAEDLDQRIWVGTGKGIAIFNNPDLVFSGDNFDATQILIEQDGNVQILLETEAVSAIVVDGANRKWLGTQSSGLYLVSADGTEQLAHFTAANSPLPSDNIICLAMDGTTGELFIGTDKGIVSYRGDATTGNLATECATVFPNPVRETWTGPVAITGLVRDSDVRITDVAGNLVYRTISKGGQAIWPVTDMSGRRVSTGVYLVLAMDPEGKTKCNTKVAVVR